MCEKTVGSKMMVKKCSIRRCLSLLLALVLCAQLSVTANAYSVVRRGSTGDDVKTLQGMLNEVEDAGLSTDGRFGPATQESVLDYQEENNLAMDGVVGPATWKSLEADYKGTGGETNKVTISSGSYSPERLKPGSSYPIYGVITSGVKLKSVTVGIYDENGRATKQVKTVYPNSKTYDIKGVNNSIRFGTLPTGHYYLKITARDANGVSTVLVNHHFIVTPANVYSLRTDGSYAVSKNFVVSEFKCKDGSDEVLIDPQLVEYLQMIRDHFGKSVKINSAYRTETHNARVGGVEDSRHVLGCAADIRIEGVSPIEIARYAESLGIKGIGLYDSFVHVDTRAKKGFWRSHSHIGVYSFQTYKT